MKSWATGIGPARRRARAQNGATPFVSRNPDKSLAFQRRIHRAHDHGGMHVINPNVVAVFKAFRPECAFGPATGLPRLPVFMS